MLLCDNCNGGYHLFCFKPELIQVLVDIWYCSSCFPATLGFLLRPFHTFRGSSLGGIYENFILASSYALYIYVRAYLFGWLIFTFDWCEFFCLVKFPMDLHPYDTVCHDNCHARMHSLIHDGRLRACPSCFLRLLYVCRVNVFFRWLYTIWCLGF
jgi:hypothetical protein